MTRFWTAPLNADQSCIPEPAQGIADKAPAHRGQPRKGEGTWVALIVLIGIGGEEEEDQLGILRDWDIPDAVQAGECVIGFLAQEALVTGIPGQW